MLLHLTGRSALVRLQPGRLRTDLTPNWWTNCKCRARAASHLPDTEADPAFRRSLPERIDHLLAEARRKASIRDAVFGRKLVLRHVEGAEQDIEDRKRRCIVLLAALLRGGVVPAVENRARQHVAEGSERPFEIGMHEGRMRDDEWPEKDQHV